MFDSPFSPPTDPMYLRFRDGLQKIADNEAQRMLWRWDPAKGEWYTWATEEWVLEDVGLADTSTGSALRDKSFGLGTPNWELSDFMVPDLYKRVHAAHVAYAARAPRLRLVWGPWGGGDWRSAWKRPGVVLPPPAPPSSPTGLPAECLKRIEWVRDAEKRGLIVHDVAQLEINKIVAECT